MPGAAVLRTWQFARALQAAGHAVDVVVLPAEGVGHSSHEISSPTLLTTRRLAALNCTAINSIQFHRALGALQEIHSRKRYDALVAVGLTAAVLASRLASPLPMWYDLGEGPGMAEAQARCRLFGSDDGLKTAWSRNRSALRRGDRFSASSFKQMYALLGELAAVGRLNRFTDGYQFVSTIPHAVPEWLAEEPNARPAGAAGHPPSSSSVYRGRLFPSGAFAVLWTGAFQPWVDVRTLASALSLAFEAEPDLHFVCTGGALPGVDDATYPGFAAELGRTGFGDRAHLLGWTTAAEAMCLMRECDLGLVVDEPGYAAILDSRARITAWMGAGLPVMTTTGSEIADTLAEHHLAYTVKMGRVQELADALVKAACHPVERQEMAARARRFALEHFTYESTTRSLVRWAGAPSLAPDNLEKTRRDPAAEVLGQIAANPLELDALHSEKNVAEELARARAELDALKRNLLVRVIGKFVRRGEGG